MLNPQENLHELELSNIDFEWVQKQTKPSFLKKALKLLEMDGNFYPDLTNAIQEKLKTLDPKYRLFNCFLNNFQRSLMESQNIDPEVKKKALEEILDFEEKMANKSKKQLFNDEEERKTRAQNEKLKGNEALKSNDLNEALNYYTKSLEFDDRLSASYCNRALVYLKLKKYKETIQDCNKALALEPNYTKALHRRGKAQFELKNFMEAVKDFQAIMAIEPDNKEVNADLKEARKGLTQKELEQLEKTQQNNEGSQAQNSGFKKIEIQVEEEEEEGEEEDSKLLKELEEKKTKANELCKKGNFVEALKLYEADLAIINKMSNKSKNILVHKANLLNNISFCHSQTGEANKAIEFASEVLKIQEIDQDQSVKALLRRALQYEKIDKVKQAKEDFLKVKELDPSNMKASEGLHRLRYVEIKHVEKTSEKNIETNQKVLTNDSEQNLKDLEVRKEKANELFRKKNFKDAKILFSEILEELEKGFKNEIKQNESKAGILYLQILNNRAFTNYNLGLHEDSIQDCDKTLSLDTKNLKGLYRRALALFEKSKLINALEEPEKIESILEKAKKDLEKILVLNKDNQSAKEKLEEIVKELVKIRMKLKEKLQTNSSKKSENEEKEKKTEKNLKKNEENAKNDQKMNDEFLNNVTFNVSKKVMEDLIGSKELPQTPNIFEKDCVAFKNDLGKLFLYIKKIPLNHFAKLFSKKDIPSEILLLILETIKLNGIKEDLEFCAKFLDNLMQTNKFDLVLMLLTKKEKKGIQDLINEIEKSDNKMEKFMQNIKKALK